MKWGKIGLVLLSSLLIISLLLSGTAYAQDGELPDPGITPDSPFYFLDRLGEFLQEFFTFSPEGKARLQITFAAERIAEIKVILKTKGVEAKGLDIAQSRLQAHIAKAATIVSKQKAKGKDVSSLAKELATKLEAPKSTLAQTFKEQKQNLKAKRDELKAKLKAAHQAGDTAQEEMIAAELGQVMAQLELLELREEDIENDLEKEEERIEEAMEAQHKAEKAIAEAEKELAELKNEAAEEGVEIPAEALGEFNSLLSQAQAAFQAENYAEARHLAKQAEKSLKQVEDLIEELEEKEEAKGEAEEAIQEIEQELQGVKAKAEERGITVPPETLEKFNSLLSQAKAAFNAENYQEAERLAERAEKALDDIEEVIEELKEAKKEERAEKRKQAGWGIIEIRVTDPPPADVTSAVVYLTNIEVHKVSDNVSEWIPIIEAPPSFDLLDVIGVEKILGSANVTAGSFTQIRMDVDRVEVVTTAGDNITAEVPSGKLKIVRPFNVEAGVKTVLTLDFDGEKSLILPGKDIATAKERALFKPVVKLLIEKEKIEEEELEESEVEGEEEEIEEEEQIEEGEEEEEEQA
jgi:hypothetical protein